MSNSNRWNEMTLNIDTIYPWIKDAADKRKLIGKIHKMEMNHFGNNIISLNPQTISKDA